MLRIVEILWLLIAAASLIVFIYLLIAEGFIAGKAWPYVITLALGGWRFWVMRKKRLLVPPGEVTNPTEQHSA